MAQNDAKTLMKTNYKLILDYIDQQKWLEAHRACLEILRLDPENIRIIRLKNKIEKEARNLNRQSIKKDLELLEPLWEQKKYAEILEYLHKLEPFTEDYPPLIQLIKKAQQAYNNQIYEQQEQNYQTTFQNIEKLVVQKKYAEAIREAEKLRLLKLHDNQLKKYLSRLRNEWIETEIATHQVLLESRKYEDILLFYQNLKRIDPSSSLLEKLIKKNKNDYQIYKIEEKKEFIYKGKEQVKTLYLLKKYERAVLAAKEVLEIDPKNKEIKYFLGKAKKKAHHQIEKEVINQMLGAQKQYKDLYKQNKKAFRKI